LAFMAHLEFKKNPGNGAANYSEEVSAFASPGFERWEFLVVYRRAPLLRASAYMHLLGGFRYPLRHTLPALSNVKSKPIHEVSQPDVNARIVFSVTRKATLHACDSSSCP
jgi:hypothetical protein